MKVLGKQEFKLFIFFFVIFSLFVHWIGWDENARLGLTRSIVDDSKLEIDNYIADTGDRAFYKNYYYTLTPPGMSFLAAPIYSSWNFIYYNFFPKDFVAANIGTNQNVTSTFYGHKVDVVTFIDPGLFIRSSMILITIFTSSLFGSLSVVLIYKILHFFTKNKFHIFLTSFIFGIATLAFPMSTVFFGGMTATFLSLLSFYIFLKNKKAAKNHLLSGIFLGLAVFVEYTPIIIVFPLFAWIFYYNKKNSLWFLLGILIGTLPLFSYNYAIFNNPLELTTFHPDLKFVPFTDITEKIFIFEIHFNTILSSLYYILFGTYRGLFFYYPILLFSFVGLFYFYKKRKVDAIFVLLIFVFYFLFNSLLVNWWSSSPGPRHLMPAIAFLSIPLVYCLDKIKNKKKVVLIFLIVVSISAFHALISFQEPEGPSIVFDDQTNQYKLVQKFSNPLYEHYLPLFLKNGPRSRVLEGLFITPEKFDIRNYELQSTSGLKFITTPLGFLSFRLQTLSIAMIILLIFLIWRKEIFRLFPKNYQYFLYLILFAIFLASLNLQTITYGPNWYAVFKNETYTDSYTWMSQDAKIYFFSSENSNAIISFYFDGYKNQTFDFIFNNKILNSYSTNQTNIVTELVELNPGENALQLHSRDSCSVPIEWNDWRCLSIEISDLTLKENR